MLLRSLLRYEAHVSLGGLWMDPVLPESWGFMHGSNAPVGTARVTVDITGTRAAVEGLPEGMVFHKGTRPPLDNFSELELLRRDKAPSPDG
jgi:hypothetical protein